MELEFFASCLPGVEKLLADELKAIGIERVRPLGGGVAFFCEPSLAYRACLWSRLASRVLLVLGRLEAGDAEQLYAGASDIEWERVIAEAASFTVRASGTNECLRNTRFTALKVKDAIADRLRVRRESRVAPLPGAARASVDVRIRARRATVSLDFSGEALTHRDYFADGDAQEAALACSRAAALLALAGWTPESAREGTFADPACRDGILLVEAASIACDRASGLGRDTWGFRAWALHDEALWESLRAEAARRFEAGVGDASGPDARGQRYVVAGGSPGIRFIGISDSSPQISRARNHVKRAGLRQVAGVERPEEVRGAIAALSSRVGEAHSAGTFLVASDIDARSRADAPADVSADEAAFTAACATSCDGSMFAAAGGRDLAARFGTEPVEKRVIGGGRIETALEVFGERPAGGARIQVVDLESGAARAVDVLEQSSEQFAARLRKVFKERRKWASREGVTCYRIYDSDLPDYAVAIDWYTGAGRARGNDYLHISEYAPPASVDQARAQRRFNDVLALAPVVCGVRPDHVFAKRRVREKGGGQYRNAGSRAYVTTVSEGGYLFEVDLAARLDTGLFLDHRITRGFVGAEAQGKRFLNLFAYTGSASVYAAGAGALSTTTVDLSQTYLDWARRNMVANGFAGRSHTFVRADVLRWLADARRARKRFDFAFVDPPTFSNSKAMGKKTWDVQRDHVELLVGVAHLLSDGGSALFSCNLRNFKPDLEELERHGIQLEDISLETIPADFARTPKIHKCYRMTCG